MPCSTNVPLHGLSLLICCIGPTCGLTFLVELKPFELALPWSLDFRFFWFVFSFTWKIGSFNIGSEQFNADDYAPLMMHTLGSEPVWHERNGGWRWPWPQKKNFESPFSFREFCNFLYAALRLSLLDSGSLKVFLMPPMQSNHGKEQITQPLSHSCVFESSFMYLFYFLRQCWKCNIMLALFHFKSSNPFVLAQLSRTHLRWKSYVEQTWLMLSNTWSNFDKVRRLDALWVLVESRFRTIVMSTNFWCPWGVLCILSRVSMSCLVSYILIRQRKQ